MTALPALPAEVIRALEAAHFEPDPFSHDWMHRAGVGLTLVFNPWDRPDDHLHGRLVVHRADIDGVRWIVGESPIAWPAPELAKAIHDWQQTLPEGESAL